MSSEEQKTPDKERWADLCPEGAVGILEEDISMLSLPPSSGSKSFTFTGFDFTPATKAEIMEKEGLDGEELTLVRPRGQHFSWGRGWGGTLGS